jgi:hypothetical protein
MPQDVKFRILVNGRNPDMEGDSLTPLSIRVLNGKIFLDIKGRHTYQLSVTELQMLYSDASINSVREYLIERVMEG